MAVDKLVDSTQLDADLTSVANAIRTKGGTSAQMAFPAGFVQAIGDIEGGQNQLQYATNLFELFVGAYLPETFTLELNGCASIINLGSIFKNTTVQNIVIKSLNISANPNMDQAFWGSDAKTITFENCSFAPNSISRAFEYCSKLESIFGELDLSSSTSNDAFYGSAKLKNITIKQNSIVSSFKCASSKTLSDASIVSIANGLNTETTNTLTFNNTVKTRCLTLMGINDNGIFVADGEGDISLESFITTVKGWTLA